MLDIFFPMKRALISTRRDKVMQAVSFFLATKSGRWASYQGNPDDAKLHVQYDFDQIKYFYDLVVSNELAIRSYLSEKNIESMEVLYEDFVSSPIEFAEKISSYFGLGKPSFSLSNVRTKKQSSELNDEMGQRFLRDLAC